MSKPETNTSATETTLALQTANAGNSTLAEQSAEEDVEFDMFSTRKPKDAVAGLSSGLKNFTKGVAAGAVSLVSLPILGAKEGGTSGFLKGLGLGVASGVLLPVAGAVTGAVQVGRGVFNTGEAIMESRDGKEWDAEKRKWYVYNLSEEAESVLNESEEEFIARMKSKSSEAKKAEAAKGESESKKAAGNSDAEGKTAPRRPPVKVKEMDYYKALQVQPNATPGEIKKAYYKLAKQLHPDKNLDDPDANIKFQKVGEAYQVLIDAELREQYNKYGKEGVGDAPTIDPSAFYAMVFGSDKFEPLVGELKLAMMMAAGTDESEEADMDIANTLTGSGSQVQLVMDYKQRRREVQIALNLAERLTQYVDECNNAVEASTDGVAAVPQFKKMIEDEAKELSQTAFGGTLLDVIGYVYIEQSLKQLGFKHSIAAGLGIGEMRRKGHVLANNYRVARSALRAYQTSRKLGAEVEKEAKAKELKAKSTQLEKEAKAKSAEQQKPVRNPNTSDTNQSTNEAETSPDNQEEEENEMDMAEKQMPFLMEMLEALWNMSIIDIESTLRKSCRKVLRDSGVSPNVRMARARGMKLIGEIFQKYGQTAEVGLGEFKQKMKDEMEASKKMAEEIAKQKHQEAKNAEEAAMMELLLHKTFTGEELAMTSIAQLKKIMELRGMSTANCVEKGDLIHAFLAQQAVQQQQQQGSH